MDKKTLRRNKSREIRKIKYKRIIELYNQKLSYEKIRKIIGCSRSTAWRVIHRFYPNKQIKK